MTLNLKVAEIQLKSAKSPECLPDRNGHRYNSLYLGIGDIGEVVNTTIGRGKIIKHYEDFHFKFVENCEVNEFITLLRKFANLIESRVKVVLKNQQ